MNSLQKNVRNTIIGLFGTFLFFSPLTSDAQFWKSGDPTDKEKIANQIVGGYPSLDAQGKVDSEAFFGDMDTYFIKPGELSVEGDSTASALADDGKQYRGDIQTIAHTTVEKGGTTYNIFAINQDVYTRMGKDLGNFVKEFNYERTGNILNQIRVLDRGREGKYDESFVIDPDSSRLAGHDNGDSELTKELEEHGTLRKVDISRLSEEDTTGLESYLKNTGHGSYVGSPQIVGVEQGADSVFVRAKSVGGYIVVVPEKEMCAAPKGFQKIALGHYSVMDENENLKQRNDSLLTVIDSLKNNKGGVDTAVYSETPSTSSERYRVEQPDRDFENEKDSLRSALELTKHNLDSLWKGFNRIVGKNIEANKRNDSLLNQIDSYKDSLDVAYDRLQQQGDGVEGRNDLYMTIDSLLLVNDSLRGRLPESVVGDSVSDSAHESQKGEYESLKQKYGSKKPTAPQQTPRGSQGEREQEKGTSYESLKKNWNK